MFAMLNGRMPQPCSVAEAVAAQVEAGLDLVTDGGARWADGATAMRAQLEALSSGDTGAGGMIVRAWRETAALAGPSVTVAAVLTGPWTLAAAADAADRSEALGRQLGGELAALASAGCQLVVVEEPLAVSIGSDGGRRAAFRAAHRAMLGNEPPVHAMLAITGGSAWEAGAETILDAPYRSYLLDLVAGPDNWYLVRAVPGDRGIVCAALRAPSAEDQAPLLVWAAQYAASGNGRGLARVGLANASPLHELDVGAAREALEAIARAARLAALEPADAIEAGLDPRTFSQPPGRGARPGRLARR